jgi:PIN domain nuclease of toxin-antitoxin system
LAELIKECKNPKI